MYIKLINFVFFSADDTDADPDYLPSGNEDNSARDLFRNRPSTSGVVVEEQNNGPPAKRPKHEGKKKTRRPDQWKRKKGSIARNKGEGYTDRTGKNHQPKQVRDFNHNCRYECSDIPQEKRQEIFNEYWALGNWELQSAFLNSVILHHSPHQTRANNEHYNKSVSCQYFLVGKRVCKEFFLKTIDISKKRVMNIVKRKQLSGTSISPRDKRGKKIPPNKTNPEKLELQQLIVHGSPDEKQAATVQKELHLCKAESAKAQLDKAKEQAKNDSSHKAEARVAAIKLGLKSSRLSDQPDTSPQWPPTRRVKPRMTHGRNPPNPAKRLPRSPPPVVDFPVTQRPRVTHGQKSEWPITSATPPQQAEVTAIDV
ncbi:uncharacterized protein LOC124363417 [Homalodisca vitripennis]|uniref:uncharacterized protein LOC124363417 n=1 Tax=Homalodisca vitripennis TaxID=197043 RepID=UPI001EE9DADD|nr:uncharacterized protein LOC124363417 [Homalodisca vitripennis]